jgi:DNA repair ATPase RecN
VLINGAPSSLRVLRGLAELLVDVNGQGAAGALREAAQQSALLDRVAGVRRCVCPCVWRRGFGSRQSARSKQASNQLSKQAIKQASN